MSNASFSAKIHSKKDTQYQMLKNKENISKMYAKSTAQHSVFGSSCVLNTFWSRTVIIYAVKRSNSFFFYKTILIGRWAIRGVIFYGFEKN